MKFAGASGGSRFEIQKRRCPPHYCERERRRRFITQQLVRAGVPQDAIELEDRSRTTKENAEFTTRMLQQRGVRRAIIVTSWFHSRRALNSFLSFAPEIQFSSLPAYHQEAFSAEA